MHKKSWHNSAKNQKYPWYLSLQSIVLIIYHDLVLVQLLVVLTDSEADRWAVTVAWMFNLEHVPETEPMQQKGLSFSCPYPIPEVGECRSQGNASKAAREMSKRDLITGNLLRVYLSAWKQISLKFNKLSDTPE